LRDFIAVTSKTAVILAQILAHRFGFPIAQYRESLRRDGQRLLDEDLFVQQLFTDRPKCYELMRAIEGSAGENDPSPSAEK
jgi:hypothetical protein